MRIYLVNFYLEIKSHKVMRVQVYVIHIDIYANEKNTHTHKERKKWPLN